MPSYNDVVGRQTFVRSDQPFEFYLFTDILLHIFGQIAIEKSVIPVLDLYDGSVYVEGKRIFDIVVLRFSVRMFVNDIRTAGNAADEFMKLHFIGSVGETVEYDHLRALNFIKHQLSHIGVIA